VDDNTLGEQLEQVAYVVAARGELGSNRDVFFVEASSLSGR
jgi:hypothetical protein